MQLSTVATDQPEWVDPAPAAHFPGFLMNFFRRHRRSDSASGIVHRLRCEEGLRLCRGIEFGEMVVTWIIQLGRAVCVITKDGQALHSSHLAAVTPVKLHFYELPLGPVS